MCNSSSTSKEPSKKLYMIKRMQKEKQHLLVGYTGLVGSNLKASHEFDNYYNSKNIEEAYGAKPDLLVYAGVIGNKLLADMYPEQDYHHIQETIENIKKINPKKLVLISTGSVYQTMVGVNEENSIEQEPSHAYGKHRRMLEKWVMDNVEDYHILRLTLLYGSNLKKNFIHDMIDIVPPMLKKDIWIQLEEEDAFVAQCYEWSSQGIYRKRESLTTEERDRLTRFFKSYRINALSFTDSRSRYQFYNLNRLWADIQIIINNNLSVVNLAPEPISAGEVYRYVMGEEFENILDNPIVQCDLRTTSAELFGGKNGYIMGKEEILKDIKQFVNRMKT